jgi:hypothetical protein
MSILGHEYVVVAANVSEVQHACVANPFVGWVQGARVPLPVGIRYPLPSHHLSVSVPSPLTMGEGRLRTRPR